MYILQKQLDNIQNYLIPGKVLVIYGARRVGKTTLINKFMERLDKKSEKILFANGDDIFTRQFLESQSIQKLKEFVGDHSILIVDEAQYVEKIGLNLKLIVDHIPNIKVIATGSSSFDLAKDYGEPLTGRKFVLKLFPLAQLEISQIEKRQETQTNLESRLIFGSYPEVIINQNNKFRQDYLRELVNSYLFKDILELNGIKHSNKLVRLLQLLALQIGKEVSFTELGTQLGISKNTVEKYTDLLEKVFVIFKRMGFSRNLRKEISKSSRYYFFDNGIRNALIGNFSLFNLRNDIGQLWENYLISERMKRNEYLREFADSYFWRTYDKREIDLIEEKEGKLFGYEMKWKKAKITIPKDWDRAYHQAEFHVVHNENYLEFIQ